MSAITEDIIINAFINKDENNIVNNDIDYEAVTEFYLDVPENKIAIILLPDNSICAKKYVLG
jgi:hypothetical protein